MAAVRLTKVRMNTILSAAFSIPVVLIAMVFHHMPYGNLIMMGLTIPVLGWFGREFFIIAWKRMLHFSANMDTLVALGTGSALFSVLSIHFSPNISFRAVWNHMSILKPHRSS